MNSFNQRGARIEALLPILCFALKLNIGNNRLHSMDCLASLFTPLKYNLLLKVKSALFGVRYYYLTAVLVYCLI